MSLLSMRLMQVKAQPSEQACQTYLTDQQAWLQDVPRSTLVEFEYSLVDPLFLSPLFRGVSLTGYFCCHDNRRSVTRRPPGRYRLSNRGRRLPHGRTKIQFT
jgi:hypothetical protein